MNGRGLVAVFLAAGCIACADDGRERLSDLGLYSDIGSKTISSRVIEYRPAFELWSDGSEKRRWLRLPEGERIDTTDADRWVFPVGTRFFKEFVRDGVLVETRMIERTGPGPRDVWLGAFIWNEDESEAYFAEDGERDARGTEHDVPDAVTCSACHVGEPGHVLGFSAVQLLSLPEDMRPATLAERVTAPLDDSRVIPGDATTVAALGTLHANCGHCHNPNGSARPDTDLDLRLDLGAASVEETTIYRSTVLVPHDRFSADDMYYRVFPGQAEISGVYGRMATRSEHEAMPPIATELTDDDGSQAVRAWIEALE